MGCDPGRKLNHVDHRNVCTESKRERDSLRHPVQLSIRCRPSTKPNECNSRFFQNRWAHACSDPGSGECSDAIANADTYRDIHTHCYRDTHTYCYGDSYTYCYGNGYTYSHGHGHGDSHGHRYCYCYCHCDADSDSYGHRNTYATTYRNT